MNNPLVADAIIVGGGPVGCATALALEAQGANVVVLEANPKACGRLAGEWLHPPAVDFLRSLGALPEVAYPTGKGFVVYPENGTEPIELSYGCGQGLAIEHSTLVETIRERVAASTITYLEGVRARRINGQTVTVSHGSDRWDCRAPSIVLATGRKSLRGSGATTDLLSDADAVACGTKCDTPNSGVYSRMAGLLLKNVSEPVPGRGHVFLGGPGPVLAYRISDDAIRLAVDVPLSLGQGTHMPAQIYRHYQSVLPTSLRPAFQRALLSSPIAWTKNRFSPRQSYGRPGLFLVGDAAGHHHPLTAVGMTLGFGDAAALAELHRDQSDFSKFAAMRLRDCRVPEMLALALYEIFADASPDARAIREAIYALWRSNEQERERTMGFLSGQDKSPLRFANSFMRAIGVAGSQLVAQSSSVQKLRGNTTIVKKLAQRTKWLLSGAMRLSSAEPSPFVDGAKAYGDAVRVSREQGEVFSYPNEEGVEQVHHLEPLLALSNGSAALIAEQEKDGSFEGEVVWCPMLAAQYVIAARLMNWPVPADRQRRILRHFDDTQLPMGAWGLYEDSKPYLFVTTLVYVASRLLGEAPHGNRLSRARAYIAGAGGVTAIPSWGKFWLALAGLYDWNGVPPVLPEIWDLPSWLPVHPRNMYCHTRLIYLGMACLYRTKWTLGDEELTDALREELYPGRSDEDHREGFGATAEVASMNRLHGNDVLAPRHPVLALVYRTLAASDQRHEVGRRERLRKELRDHIEFEFTATDYTNISPVSGLLHLLALHQHDPEGEVVVAAKARFDAWFWEDDVAGSRIAGARSSTWDTAFVLQAMNQVAPHVDVSESSTRALEYLLAQRIQNDGGRDYQSQARIDPTGGYCFAGGWHGWPVSDCTAEALLGQLGVAGHPHDAAAIAESAAFMLRTQNKDGGFGSYEAQKTRFPLEWMNPAEMFGDSMTERSFIECTASCVAALSKALPLLPARLVAASKAAVARGVAFLRGVQRLDGAWDGAWGLHLIYGTTFALRGLIEAGVPSHDPAIQLARSFLLAAQHQDGGWGENPPGPFADRFHDAPGHAVQTAWALSALLEAEEPTFEPLARAAAYLAREQQADGTWPKQEMVGIFFGSARLRYDLYRAVFPTWALAQYESRRLSELAFHECARRRPASNKSGPKKKPVNPVTVGL